MTNSEIETLIGGFKERIGSEELDYTSFFTQIPIEFRTFYVSYSETYLDYTEWIRLHLNNLEAISEKWNIRSNPKKEDYDIFVFLDTFNLNKDKALTPKQFNIEFSLALSNAKYADVNYVGGVEMLRILLSS